MEKWPLRGSNGGSKGVKMGSWGSNLIWALIFTKFGGKERFCKLLNNLSLDLQFFDFESPVWPSEGVKWGSNLIWALIFTKFGGKECFCKLLKDLSFDLQFFDFESPIWPQKGSNGGHMGVKWGPNRGQTLFELRSSPYLVERSVFVSC